VKDYAAHRNYVLKKANAASRNARDIGRIPPVFDAGRRSECERNFRLFCETYFARRFHLAWSDDHLKVIARIQSVVLDGGLYAISMARGSGKTSLCEIGALWAMLYGHRSFLVLIASDEAAAKQILDAIKEELSGNDILASDFPETCFPIRKLEGIYHRSNGQLCQGERTRISWTASEISLPVIRGSKSSSAIIRTAGITGRIRGMKATRPSDGKTVRPDLCIIDDPQTDESARSPAQSQARLDTINGAILNLSGPGTKISCLSTLTVIEQGDLADELLNAKKHPEWQGHRCRLVYKWPDGKAKELWEQYADRRATGFANGTGIKEATEFYRINRSKMDEGAIVGWPARHNFDELSALQHAFNLKLRDEGKFQSEYQNEPLSLASSASDLPTADEICTHIGGLEKGFIPLACSKLVAFIDVQQRCLFYVVAAFGDDFTGQVIEYGVWPDQGRKYFTLGEVQKTLARAKPGAALEAQIYNGLEQLTSHLMSPWRHENGSELFPSRILVDAAWGDSTSTIRKFAREYHKGIILPSFGRGIGPDRMPMNEYTKHTPGDRAGWNWRATSSKAGRHVIYDSNAWKSFLFNRLRIPRGDKGSLTLFKSAPANHKLLADHLLSEYSVLTSGQGRQVSVWKLRPGRDNHWLDCLVGCCVAASEQGCVTIGHNEAKQKTKPRRQYAVTF